jgi:hypothetical protein
MCNMVLILDLASLSYGDAKLGRSLGSHDIGPLTYVVADQDAEQAACDDQQARGLQGIGEAGRFEWFACHGDSPAFVGAISDVGAVTRLADVPG